MERPAPGLLRGATLYFDCYAGLAGDMTLAALLDLGVPEAAVRDALQRLALPGWEMRVYPTLKGVMAATKVDVIDTTAHAPQHEAAARPAHLHEREHAHSHHEHEHGLPDRAHEHKHTEAAPGHSHHEEADPSAPSQRGAAVAQLHVPQRLHNVQLHTPAAAGTHAHAPGHGGHGHRHYGEIRGLIQRSALDADVAARALQIFERIAEVEAALHGVSVAEVTFHEVGAIDSIIDIVGVAAALSWLRPRRVVARPVPLGSGMVRTAHGLLPVPAPATLALLTGVPVEHGGPPFELTTPTGAAILAANVNEYGAMPAMRILGVGHGAGTRELADRPNLLRIIAGNEPAAAARTAEAGAQCVVLAANIDDMNPQLYEPLLEGLLAAGARDVWLTPVQMKKGRPGAVVNVLCDPDKKSALTRLLLRESTSLGVRSHEVARTMLAREIVEVATDFGPVAVKLGREPESGELWNVAPEYESCRAQARARGVPIKQVFAAALAAFHHQNLAGPGSGSKPST